MATYVAFLRAINLGAKRTFPKADLQRVVEETGACDVAVHLNTGNVRLTSRQRSTSAVEKTLEAAFLADRGFEVPTVVPTRPGISSMAIRVLGDAVMGSPCGVGTELKRGAAVLDQRGGASQRAVAPISAMHSPCRAPGRWCGTRRHRRGALDRSR